MTEKEYLSIEKALHKAEESVTPFAIPGDDEITIVGDANETQRNIHDFKIRFRVPKRTEDGEIYYDHPEIEYNDVIITPRTDPKVVQAMNALFPFFKKVEENGGIGKYTEEEKLELAASFDDEITDRLYDIVATVLGVDNTLKNFMEYESVLNAVGQIFTQYPEAVNEADTFFPSSSAGRTRRTLR